MDVYRPKPKQGANLGAIGSIAGLAFGGPAGASVGNTVGNILQPEQKQAANVETAMTRRQAQLDQSPLRQIRESIDSLKYIPDPAQRAELAMPLMKADYMARRKV